jgi:hypothetical protein
MPLTVHLAARLDCMISYLTLGEIVEFECGEIRNSSTLANIGKISELDKDTVIEISLYATPCQVIWSDCMVDGGQRSIVDHGIWLLPAAQPDPPASRRGNNGTR